MTSSGLVLSMEDMHCSKFGSSVHAYDKWQDVVLSAYGYKEIWTITSRFALSICLNQDSIFKKLIWRLAGYIHMSFTSRQEKLFLFLVYGDTTFEE